MPPYLLDANFFITAHRTSYPLDVFPSFWEKVKELAVSGKIGSIDKVKKEIYENDDELKRWCEENLPEDFFNESVHALSEYAQVVNWAYTKLDNPYSQAALNIFMDADEADAFWSLSQKNTIWLLLLMRSLRPTANVTLNCLMLV